MYLPLTLRGHPSNSFRFVWKIFLIALGLRLGFVLFYPQMPPHLDALWYDQVGWYLATGKGLAREVFDPPFDFAVGPEVMKGPVYPAFLALIYLTFGHNLIAVRIIQAFLSAAAILPLYSKVREAFGNEVGKLSGILIALFPAFFIYSGVLLTETLFLFLLSLVIWVLIRAVQSDSAWGWVLAGSVMGVTILLRKETLAMMVVFVALIRWKFPQRMLIRKLSIFLLATALTVGVWTARNYLVYQEFIPVSVQGGDALWISTKGWTEWRDDEGLRSLIEGLDPIETQKVLQREGIRNILNDPLHYFIFCIKRLPHFWIASHTGHLMGFSGSFKQYYINGAFGKLFVKFMLLGAYTGLIFMGVWGVFITLKAEKERLGLKLFFLVPVLVKAITHFFLVTEARMQVPIMPFVLVFAASALCRLALMKRLPLLRSRT